MAEIMELGNVEAIVYTEVLEYSFVLVEKGNLKSGVQIIQVV
jgi:hypothetical protein